MQHLLQALLLRRRLLSNDLLLLSSGLVTSMRDLVTDKIGVLKFQWF